MSLRRLAHFTGALLMAFGALVLAFAAYQLWGTGFLESHSQRTLLRQFRIEQANPPTTQNQSLALGSAVALIQIPKIYVDKAVVQGVAEPNLQVGPGHYVGTPLPGQKGNAAIAGHRTTFGAPFYRLNYLQPGDPIFVTTVQGRFRYTVLRSFVVSPSDTAVVGPSNQNILTLTTCTPLYSAAQRLIVQAALQGKPVLSSAPPTKTTSAKPSANSLAPSSTPLSVPRSVPPTGTTHASKPHASKPTAISVPWEVNLSTLGHTFKNSPRAATAVWGAITAALFFLIRAASKGGILRRLVGWTVGGTVVLASLFIFFTALNPLLPAYL